MRHPANGFTLIELSVVLAIIALLMGAIMGGVALTRSAGARSIGIDFQRYQQAIHQFDDKYNGLPGDLANATSYWGVAAGDGTGIDQPCIDQVVASGTATCNGDASGVIGNSQVEYYRVWQHLANAGLIGGYYTGASDVAGDYDDLIGTNIPKSKIPGIGFGIGNYDNSITTRLPTSSWILAARCCTSSVIDNAALLVDDAQSIDSKLDDGSPGYGMIQPLTDATNCMTTSDPTTAVYNVSYTTGPACSLAFNIGL